MKITVEHKSTPRVIDGRLIEVGTVFRGKVGIHHEPSLFLRTYDQIVDLERPNHVWSMSGRPTPLHIENYVEHDVEIIDRGPKQ